MLVTTDGGEIVTIPPHPPEANRMVVTAKLKLDDAGVLAGDVREVRTGLVAAEMRSYLSSLKNDTERKQYVERRFARHLTQSSVSDLMIENLDDIDKELVFRCTLNANGYSKRAAGMLLAQSVPLMLVLFLLVPRVPGPLWGLPQDAYSGVSGLSDTMTPGSLSNLILSDSVAIITMAVIMTEPLGSCRQLRAGGAADDR